MKKLLSLAVLATITMSQVQATDPALVNKLDTATILTRATILPIAVVGLHAIEQDTTGYAFQGAEITLGEHNPQEIVDGLGLETPLYIYANYSGTVQITFKDNNNKNGALESGDNSIKVKYEIAGKPIVTDGSTKIELTVSPADGSNADTNNQQFKVSIDGDQKNVIAGNYEKTLDVVVSAT